MTNNKLNVGFIGAGFIGQIAHLANFSEVANCNIYALAEMRPQLRSLVGAKYSIPALYQHHSELLNDPKVDAVVVVVPRAYTAQIVLACIKAGKHVLSEKPMAGNYAQALTLVEAATEHKVQYCVGYMKRHDAGVIKAKAMLDEILSTDKLGKILHVKGYCYMGNSYCNASGHIITNEEAQYATRGGMVAPEGFNAQENQLFARYVNVYSHLTNLLNFFFERSPEVEYFNFIHPTAHTCVLNYHDFLATLETGESTSHEWDEGIDIQFEHGKLSVRLPPALLKQIPAKVSLYEGGDVQTLVELYCQWSWAFKNQAQAFIDNILENRPSVIDAKYALEDLRLIEEIWQKRC